MRIWFKEMPLGTKKMQSGKRSCRYHTWPGGQVGGDDKENGVQSDLRFQGQMSRGMVIILTEII